MKRIALLFDLDGTLIDSDDLHAEAFAEMLAETGSNLSSEEYKERVMGRSNAEIMAYLFPDLPDKHAQLADRKEALFRSKIPASVTPTPGAEELLEWAASHDVAVAVVTNAPRSNADAMLSAMRFEDRFDAVIVADECGRAKPDPLPYRNAMQTLGATPSTSVAFEDSRSGLRAARRSGAHVFGLMTAFSADELLHSGAHQAIADFTDPKLSKHLEMLKADAA